MKTVTVARYAENRKYVAAAGVTLHFDSTAHVSSLDFSFGYTCGRPALQRTHTCIWRRIVFVSWRVQNRRVRVSSSSSS